MNGDEHDDRCGRPQDGPGHPRSGWIKVHAAGKGGGPDLWFCSPRCLVRAFAPGVATQIAADMTARAVAGQDVATCPACITRHERGHRCRSCGHAPPPPIFRGLGIPDRRGA